MKKLLLLMLLICTPAYAEKVRVFTDYSPVRILKLVDKTSDFDLEADKTGLKGSFKDTEEASIPQDREDRDAWEWKSGVIKIAADKKADISKKKSDKVSAIGKLKTLGLNDDELASLGMGTGE